MVQLLVNNKEAAQNSVTTNLVKDTALMDLTLFNSQTVDSRKLPTMLMVIPDSLLKSLTMDNKQVKKD
jgi:hypothetical protein